MAPFALLLIITAPLFETSYSLYHQPYNPQPPEQDQCKNVNATEPKECPNHIGPPCPPCYTNDRPDYISSDPLNYSASTKQTMTEFMQWYINWWPSNYPPSKTASGYNIFTGSAGRAQIHLRLYNHTQNETYLSIANEYIQNALSLLPKRQTYASYMFGHSGVWMLAAIIEGINGNNQQQNEYFVQITNLYKSVQSAIMNGDTSVDSIDLTKCGLDEGLSGMLYGALFLNRYFERDIIASDIISNLTFYILDFGIESGAKLDTDYLQYECPFIKDCYLWGPGHGATGVLHTVFVAYSRYPNVLSQMFDENGKYYAAIKNTLDFFISIQLADGNMPTNTLGTCQSDYGTDSDARVQWCHGAPGFVNIFSQSAELFGASNVSASEIYLHAALRTSNVTFERGLLTKGTMYCHGIGGNINMLWELGHRLKHLQEHGSKELLDKLAADGYDLEYFRNQSVWRAKEMVIWTLNWENVEATRMYDSNEGYSMYQGNFALPMTYVQMLSDGWPFEEPVCHPGWNLCL